MPIQSKAQWKYLWATKPEMARRWVDHTTTSYSDLPKKKKKSRGAEKKALSLIDMDALVKAAIDPGEDKPSVGDGGDGKGPPNYRAAPMPNQSCGACKHYSQGLCAKFGVAVDPAGTCDKFEPLITDVQIAPPPPMDPLMASGSTLDVASAVPGTGTGIGAGMGKLAASLGKPMTQLPMVQNPVNLSPMAASTPHAALDPRGGPAQTLLTSTPTTPMRPRVYTSAELCCPKPGPSLGSAAATPKPAPSQPSSFAKAGMDDWYANGGNNYFCSDCMQGFDGHGGRCPHCGKDVRHSNKKMHPGIDKQAAHIPVGGTAAYDYHCTACNHSFDGQSGICPLCAQDRTSSNREKKVIHRKGDTPANDLGKAAAAQPQMTPQLPSVANFLPARGGISESQPAPQPANPAPQAAPSPNPAPQPVQQGQNTGPGGWDMSKGWYGGFFARQALQNNPQGSQTSTKLLPPPGQKTAVSQVLDAMYGEIMGAGVAEGEEQGMGKRATSGVANEVAHGAARTEEGGEESTGCGDGGNGGRVKEKGMAESVGRDTQTFKRASTQYCGGATTTSRSDPTPAPFVLGFLRACTDQGLTADQTMERMKTAAAIDFEIARQFADFLDLVHMTKVANPLLPVLKATGKGVGDDVARAGSAIPGAVERGAAGAAVAPAQAAAQTAGNLTQRLVPKPVVIPPRPTGVPAAAPPPAEFGLNTPIVQPGARPQAAATASPAAPTAKAPPPNYMPTYGKGINSFLGINPAIEDIGAAQARATLSRGGARAQSVAAPPQSATPRPPVPQPAKGPLPATSTPPHPAFQAEIDAARGIKPTAPAGPAVPMTDAQKLQYWQAKVNKMPDGPPVVVPPTAPAGAAAPAPTVLTAPPGGVLRPPGGTPKMVRERPRDISNPAALRPPARTAAPYEVVKPAPAPSAAATRPTKPSALPYADEIVPPPIPASAAAPATSTTGQLGTAAASNTAAKSTAGQLGTAAASNTAAKSTNPILRGIDATGRALEGISPASYVARQIGRLGDTQVGRAVSGAATQGLNQLRNSPLANTMLGRGLSVLNPSGIARGMGTAVERGLVRPADYLFNLATGKGALQTLAQGRLPESVLKYGLPTMAIAPAGQMARGETVSRPPNILDAYVAPLQTPVAGARWLNQQLGTPIPAGSSVGNLLGVGRQRTADPAAYIGNNFRDIGSVLDTGVGAFTNSMQQRHARNMLNSVPEVPGMLLRGITEPIGGETTDQQVKTLDEKIMATPAGTPERAALEEERKQLATDPNFGWRMQSWERNKATAEDILANPQNHSPEELRSAQVWLDSAERTKPFERYSQSAPAAQPAPTTPAGGLGADSAAPSPEKQKLIEIEEAMAEAWTKSRNQELLPEARKQYELEFDQLRQQHKLMAIASGLQPQAPTLKPLTPAEVTNNTAYVNLAEQRLDMLKQKFQAGQPLSEAEQEEGRGLMKEVTQKAFGLAYHNVAAQTGVDQRGFEAALANPDPAHPINKMGAGVAANALSEETGKPVTPDKAQGFWGGLEPWQKAIMLAGLGMGLFGLMNTLGGEGGLLGPILVGLGLAGAGIGLSGGKPGQLTDINFWRDTMAGRKPGSIPPMPTAASLGADAAAGATAGVAAMRQPVQPQPGGAVPPPMNPPAQPITPAGPVAPGGPGVPAAAQTAVPAPVGPPPVIRMPRGAPKAVPALAQAVADPQIARALTPFLNPAGELDSARMLAATPQQLAPVWSRLPGDARQEVWNEAHRVKEPAARARAIETVKALIQNSQQR